MSNVSTNQIKSGNHDNQANHGSDNIPNLRFPGFDGGWENRRFGELLINSRLGGNYANSEKENDKPLIKMGNLRRGNIILDKLDYIEKEELINEKDRIQFGDLFFNTRNTLELVGKVAIWRDQLTVAYYNSNLLYIKFRNNFFMNYRLNSLEGIKGLRRLATGTTSVAAIYTKDLLKLKLTIPSNENEQQKIASFLSAVDQKIQQLTRKKELLELYKKGVMQKIFSREIRFKPALTEASGADSADFDSASFGSAQEAQPAGASLEVGKSRVVERSRNYPDWEEKTMGEVFERVTRKNKENSQNVLTISAQQGLINQEEFFNKSVAAKDVTSYYLLKKGEFVYNKSYSKGYPMGAIKRLKRYNKGVVSTLYICFKIKGDTVPEFYEEFLDYGGINKELHKIAQEGARNHGLLNMSVIEFFKDMQIQRPNVKEQRRIADFLNALNLRIEHAIEQLTQTQKFKKGLLQQMFV